jgi:hypothetical protein
MTSTASLAWAARALWPTPAVHSHRDQERHPYAGARHQGRGWRLDDHVVSEEPTDEPNGVTVQIPSSLQQHRSKAKAFFRFWQPGTVLLNGQDPTGLNSHKITDDLLMIPNEGQDWLVMGNVPYPVTFNHGLNGYNVVAYVPIGDVAFAPSREALNYDKKQTKETLAALEIKIKESIPGAVQRQVDEAKTAVEAMRAATIWREALGRYPHEVHVSQERDSRQVFRPGEPEGQGRQLLR